VLLVTGDGDFLQVVRALQNKGCRVEVLAFRNVSRELQHEADAFYSGYLVPGLIPSRGDARVPWGELGSRIRGICIRWEADRGFGFIRFLTAISARLWVTDTRQEDSPYESAFVHISDLPRELDTDDLPSRDIILEFDLESSETEKGGFIARRCTVVNRYDGRTGGLAKLPDRAVAMEREEEEGPSSKGEAKEIAAVADPS
jgi:hypothetical protein